MRKHHFLTGLLALLFCLPAGAQSTIDRVLSEVSKNNKTLQAHALELEAQKLQYKTGINPANPTFEYDYLKGSPDNSGNQQEINISQQFDFPSAYIKRSGLAKEQSVRADIEFTAARQEILFEAQLICIELVYRNKLQRQLSQQKQNIEKMLIGFQTKLDKGEGNILEVNKTKLQLIDINKESLENQSALSQLNEKLTALNGGLPVAFTDTVYPTLPDIPPFEKLESDYESADPVRKSMEQQKRIAQKQLELNRALWLPKLELGYRYQGISSQSYNGIHTGISIPLWEHKNTVKLQKAKLLFDDMNIQAHRNEHYYEIKQLYENYSHLKITLQEYQTILIPMNTITLLNKALAAGQISTIEYFLEMNYYASALSNYYRTEKEFHETVAALYKFRL